MTVMTDVSSLLIGFFPVISPTSPSAKFQAITKKLIKG